MKKMTTLIVLAIVAAALIGGFFFIRSRSEGQNGEEEALLFQAEALARIEVEYKGETLRFEKEDGMWTYPEDRAFPLNAAYVRDMENRLKELTAPHTFSEENPDFGLEEPACVIDAESAEGETVRCELGRVNDTSDVVYARVNGQVCALDDGVAKCFLHTLREMARKDLIPALQAFDTRSVTVENRHGAFTVRRDGEEWVLSDGREADEESVKQLIAAVSDTSLGDLTVYHPTEEDLLFYGLEEPLYAVSVENDRTDLELSVGECERDGALYVYLPQWDCLNGTEKTAGEPAGMTEEDLRNRKLFSAAYADVKTITYRNEGEEEDTEIAGSDTRWEVYYLLRNMRAEGTAEEAAEPEFYLTLVTEAGTIPLSWGIYDENFYSVGLPDGDPVLVSKKDIASVYELLDTEAEGAGEKHDQSDGNQ